MGRTLSRLTCALLIVGLLAPSASAFSTRIHIYLANQIRGALMASGDGSITLLGSGSTVILDMADADAIVDHPEYFRAGAIGPDNFMFPAMTDGTHAVGLRPYEQCELLYDDAILDTERAYALGCFLHGATDAIAHHYVNFMTGETFTLTPLSAARQSDFTNVVRHIVAESQIQAAVFAQNPGEFEASDLAHTIPFGFVMRNYLDRDSALYQLLGKHAVEKFEALEAANPGAELPELAALGDFAPVEYLILIPYWLDKLKAIKDGVEANLKGRLAELQNHASTDGSELLVEPGPDGLLGTYDDDTDCYLTCPVLVAEYFLHVGLFAQRYDAWNQPLPSAYDAISAKLTRDARRFPLVMLQTIQNVSSTLNGPLSGGESGLGIDSSQLEALMSPMTDWADDLTNVDYKTLSYAVTPDVILSVDSLLAALGIDIGSILQAMIDPILEPIRTAIKNYAIQAAKDFLEPVIQQIEEEEAAILAEYSSRLVAASDPALNGEHALDHWNDSGFFAHAFNITAATLANHAVILPNGDDPEELGVGPSSFDTSFTPHWSQAGLCPYLVDDIFPYGLGLSGLLSVKIGATEYPSPTTEDSPIECHDGSLTEFTDAPTVANCQSVGLEELIDDPAHEGSLSRGFPPPYAQVPPSCQNIIVPGLPEPPPSSGATAGLGAGQTRRDRPVESLPLPESPTVTGGFAEATVPGVSPDPAETGCDAGGAGGATWWLLAVGLLVALRRRKGVLVVLAALGLTAGGCDAVHEGGGCQKNQHALPEQTGQNPDPAVKTSISPSVGELPKRVIELPERAGELPARGPKLPEWDDSVLQLEGTELYAELGTSVWQGVQVRLEDGELVSRAVEMHFDAENNGWVEIVNPYGPGRLMRFRGFVVDADEASVFSTVIQQNEWAFEPLNGLDQSWVFEVVDLDDGSPRELLIYGEDSVEWYEEGSFPQPDSGLTAHVRAFGAGPIEDAFCTSGLNTIDRDLLIEFARGGTGEPVFDEDWVAGAHLMSWYDDTGGNQFAVTNVNGFERWGGTKLHNQYNFTVRYTGTIDHPGGSFAMREQDDSVEDLVWAFVGPDVGSTNYQDLFLEVHGFLTPDLTVDEPSTSFAAGEVPVEIILVRCANSIETVRVEMKLGSGSWKKVGLQPSTPDFPAALFPSPF